MLAPAAQNAVVPTAQSDVPTHACMIMPIPESASSAMSVICSAIVRSEAASRADALIELINSVPAFSASIASLVLATFLLHRD